MKCSVLTEKQIDLVHEASLAILDRVGVIVPHEDMLSRLSDRGARVDAAEQRVRMPADLVEWAIENRAVFDFLCHPSCMVVEDPKFETIRLICDLVERSQGRAEIVSLDEIAARVSRA